MSPEEGFGENVQQLPLLARAKMLLAQEGGAGGRMEQIVAELQMPQHTDKETMLRAIESLGPGAVEELVQKNADGLFLSIDDFLEHWTRAPAMRQFVGERLSQGPEGPTPEARPMQGPPAPVRPTQEPPAPGR